MLNIIYNKYPKIQKLQYSLSEYYKKKTKGNIRWNTTPTKNNIFSTIVSNASKKTITKSAGSLGITKKKTSNIVHRYLIKLFSLFIHVHNLPINIVFRKGIVTRKKKMIVSHILSTNLRLSNIYGFVTIPHGGTKLNKKRRL